MKRYSLKEIHHPSATQINLVLEQITEPEFQEREEDEKPVCEHTDGGMPVCSGCRPTLQDCENRAYKKTLALIDRHPQQTVEKEEQIKKLLKIDPSRVHELMDGCSHEHCGVEPSVIRKAEEEECKQYREVCVCLKTDPCEDLSKCDYKMRFPKSQPKQKPSQRVLELRQRLIEDAKSKNPLEDIEYILRWANFTSILDYLDEYFN